MRVRPVVVTVAMACVLCGAVAGAAPEALAGSGQAASAQTHPSVRPKVGHRHSTFTMTFTLAQTPGRTGFVLTDYRAVVSPQTHAAQSCSPTPPPAVFTGHQGATTHIALHPPVQGWCKGRYVVTVFLERAPVCGPPIQPAGFIPCPLIPGAVPTFRTVDLNTGQTHFTVR